LQAQLTTCMRQLKKSFLPDAPAFFLQLPIKKPGPATDAASGAAKNYTPIQSVRAALVHARCN
jgi:hypothetical protein